MFREALLILLAATLGLAGCSTTPPDADPGNGARDIRALQETAKQEPDNARRHYELGNALFDARRYTEALLAYGRSIEVDPQFEDAYTNRGLTHRNLNNLDAAVADYAQALELQPGDPVTLQNMVIVLQAQGRTVDVLPYLERLVALRPEDVRLNTELAALYLALERFTQSAGEYQHLVELDPGNLDHHHNLGLSYFYLEQWSDAITTWTTIVLSDNSRGRAHLGLAMAYMQAGKFDESWAAVGECERLGVGIPGEFITNLRLQSGRLSPD